MLGNEIFYWEHFRKYVSLMGTLLNDISITRKSNGKTKTIKIPIAFAQRDKQLNILLSNPELNNTWKNYLPRMSFEMGSPMYDSDRKDNSGSFYYTDDDGNKRMSQHPPAPYDIPFTVYLWVPYYEDALQVVEQIIPFFQPEYFVSVTEIPELKLTRDVSVALLSVTQNDMLEGDFRDARIIEWQFEFNLKGWFYGPMNENKIIKKTMVDYFFDFDKNDPTSPVIIQTTEVLPLEAIKSEPHIIIEKTEYNE